MGIKGLKEKGESAPKSTPKKDATPAAAAKKSATTAAKTAASTPAVKKATPGLKEKTLPKEAKPEPKSFEGEDPDDTTLDSLLGDGDELEDDTPVAEEGEEEIVDDDPVEELEDDAIDPELIGEAITPEVVKSKDSKFTVGKPTSLWVSCSAKVVTRQYENADVGTGVTIQLPDNVTDAQVDTAREEAWTYCEQFVDEIITVLRNKAKSAARKV